MSFICGGKPAASLQGRKFIRQQPVCRSGRWATLKFTNKMNGA